MATSAGRWLHCSGSRSGRARGPWREGVAAAPCTYRYVNEKRRRRRRWRRCSRGYRAGGVGGDGGPPPLPGAPPHRTLSRPGARACALCAGTSGRCSWRWCKAGAGGDWAVPTGRFDGCGPRAGARPGAVAHASGAGAKHGAAGVGRAVAAALRRYGGCSRGSQVSPGHKCRSALCCAGDGAWLAGCVCCVTAVAGSRGRGRPQE